MALDLDQINGKRLAAYLLDTSDRPGNWWRREVDVVHRDGRVLIFHPPSGLYLRHSKGPRHHGWDSYGDDYQNLELAIIAISEAPAPTANGPSLASNASAAPGWWSF